jgi:hypothetical protein
MLVALSLAPRAEAQERTRPRPALLRVEVVDDSTGQAVAGARVRVSGISRTVLTDAAGAATVGGVVAGLTLVQVDRPGYAMRRFPVTTQPGDTLALEVGLVPQREEVVLETLRVTSWGRRRALIDNGFYERQQAGSRSRFLTREDVAAIRPNRTIDLFYRLPGFTVTPTGRAGRLEVQTTRGPAGLGSRKCVPDVYLDGIRVGTAREGDALGELDAISPESVEALEAYASPATVPAQFNRTGAACGVVAIWTRTGT